MDYEKEVQEVQEAQEVSGTKAGKLFWFIFFGIIFIAIFLAVYLIFNGSKKNISDDSLMEGVAMEVGENDVVNFELDREEHGMWINFVGDSVELTISSEPINVSLNINEIKEIDLNNDGIFDIKIKLVSIVNGKATIAIQKIQEESCKEDWKCSEWSSCFKGVQKRKCEDLNSCGKLFNKPAETKECLEIEFVENDSVFNEEQNNKENESVNNTANFLNSTLPINNTGIKITINKSDNTSLENGTNTSVNHTYANNRTDKSPSINVTNSTSSNNPVNNTNITISGSAENHSTTDTSSTTGSSPCPSGSYFCNEYYGYVCKTDYILNPNSPSCCFNQCLKILSSEYLCYARGYKSFIGNETHICKVQVYTYFNATTVPCCSVIEARYNTTSTTGYGGTGTNINPTNYSGLTNQN